MREKYLTVDEIAERLELTAYTVRRYIREGKLPARKIGKEWRITEADLEVFLGNFTSPSTDTNTGTAERSGSRKVSVSAVIDIRVEDEEEALRVSNAVLAVVNMKGDEYGPVQYEYIHYPGEGKARFLFWGDPTFIAELILMLARFETYKFSS